MADDGAAPDRGAAAALPRDARLVRTTVEFDEFQLPTGLLRAHHLATGTWGLLHVRSGSLRFVFEDDDAVGRVVESGETQIIPPEVRHHVELVGPVRFVIEFHRSPAD